MTTAAKTVWDAADAEAVTAGGRLHPQNRKEFEAMLRDRFYIGVMLRHYSAAIARHGMPNAASHLRGVMRDSEDEVGELIQGRIDANEITDKGQTSKSIAGNGFQALTFCALASMQARGLIPPDLRFTLKTRNLVGRGGDFIIEVGPEKIKPDVDLLVVFRPHRRCPPLHLLAENLPPGARWADPPLEGAAGHRHRRELPLHQGQVCPEIRWGREFQAGDDNNQLLRRGGQPPAAGTVPVF